MTLLATARYIPVGRVLVNMAAGALSYPFTRFLAITVIGAAVWSAFISTIGLAVGTWFRGAPLLATIASILLALVVGLVIDVAGKVVRRARSRWRDREGGSEVANASPNRAPIAGRSSLEWVWRR